MYFKDGYNIQYRAKFYFEHPSYDNLMKSHGSVVKITYSI